MHDFWTCATGGSKCGGDGGGGHSPTPATLNGRGTEAREHKQLTTNPFPRSVGAEDDWRGGSTVEQASSGLQW